MTQVNRIIESDSSFEPTRWHESSVVLFMCVFVALERHAVTRTRRTDKPSKQTRV